MNINRDVISDLLPTYVSGEASAATRALVEEFVRQDPEFAAIVQAARNESSDAMLTGPSTMPPDQERAAVTRTRAVIRRQRWSFAFAFFLTLLPLSFSFGANGARFFLLRDEPRIALIWIPAAILWFSHLRMQRRLETAGL
jgi:anti-sigma factor RsiW